MRRIGFYLFIMAIFLLAPLLALPQKAVPAPAAVPTPAPTAVARRRAYRAVWVSYLEWEQVDFSSAEAFTQAIGTMLDNIQSIGATVVLAQVRPFGDALYPSDYFRSAPLHRHAGQDPGLIRWHCCWTPPTRGAYSWKPGSTLTASRPGRPRHCAAQARRGCTRTGSGTPTPARISTPPTRTCGSTLPTGWGSCAQDTLWTASTLTTIFTPPPTRPLTRRTTRPAAAH